MDAPDKDSSPQALLRRAGAGPLGLRLRPDLEARFMADWVRANDRSFRIILIALTSVSALALAVNLVSLMTLSPTIFALQVGILAVLLAVTLVQRHPAARFNPVVLAIFAVVAVGFLVGGLFFFAEPSRLMNVVVLVFLAIVVQVVLPFPFVVRLVGLSALAAAFCWGAWHRGLTEQPHFRGLMLMFLVAASVALLSAFVFDRAQRVAFLMRLELEAERAWSQRLLASILPERYSTRLREASGEGRAIVERHEEVAILFADLVGFSALATRRSPESVVVMLNELFSRFDAIAATLNVEKIKTIGDAYLAVAGLSEKRQGQQCLLAEMALEMRAAVEDYAQQSGEPLQIRIGIHCGTVVAGVIGTSRFQFDLWGEAVNLASRMESHGLPGEIQVSEAMRNALLERYDLMSRGDIAIKGIGRAPAFILVGRKTASREMPQVSPPPSAARSA